MTGVARRIAFILPGQGSQFSGMAVDRYRHDRAFARIADEFFVHLGPEGGAVREDWLAASPLVPIDDGSRAQPMLFVIGYAIGKTLMERGVRPAVLLGHSVGELAAATLAGVFDLPAAGRIIAARSRVLRAAPAGGMLAVGAPPEKVLPLLVPEYGAAGVVVGAFNAPRQTVLSGPDPELSFVEAELRAAGLAARRVRACQPFHSPVLTEVASRFEAAVAAETLRPPRIPIISARTGAPVTAEEAATPEFWAGQLAKPVRFWAALTRLLDEPTSIVETGPGTGLSTLARRHPSLTTGGSGVITLPAVEDGDAWDRTLNDLR